MSSVMYLVYNSFTSFPVLYWTLRHAIRSDHRAKKTATTHMLIVPASSDITAAIYQGGCLCLY